MPISENPDITLWIKAGNWFENTAYHKSRFLNPDPFFMVQDPVYKDGIINDYALLQLTKANELLIKFCNNLKRQIENHLKDEENFWNTQQISEGDIKFLNEIQTCKNHFAPNVAIIHEWVDRNYPESSGIIANDKTRKNPYYWIDHAEEINMDPCALGLDYDGEMDDWHVMLEPGQEMPVRDIKIEEKHFFDAVDECCELSFKVNFALTQCCIMVNYLNFCSLEQETREKGYDEDEILALADQMTEPRKSGPYFLNRYNEVLYRGRNFPLKVDIPTNIDPYYELEKNGFLPLNFWKSCPHLQNELRSALKNLKKHGQSISFKGAKLERWKKLAENLNEYTVSKNTVYHWYQDRLQKVDDQSLVKAINYLLTVYKDYKINPEEKTLFIADQTIIRDMVRRKEEIPSTGEKKEIKDKVTAIKEFSPQLEKLGLKIVPSDAVVIENLGNLPSVSDIINKPVSTQNIANYVDYIAADEVGGNTWDKWFKNWDSVQEIWSSSSSTDSTATPKPPIKVESKIVEKSEYGEKLKYAQKLEKWKDNKDYQDNYRTLGGQSECTTIDIAKLKLGTKKRVLTEDEEDAIKYGKMEKPKGAITRKTAHNIGKDIVNENQLQPVHGFKVLTKEEAILKAFHDAVREALKIKPYAHSDITEKKEQMKNAKQFSTNIDKVFEQHLKKLKLQDEKIAAYKELAVSYEGNREPLRGATYSTSEVAIIWCENMHVE